MIVIIIVALNVCEAKTQTTAQPNSPLPPKVDSLRNVLEATRADTSRVDVLVNIARELWSTNPTRARTYAHEALGVAERVAYPKGIGNALNTIGVTYYYQGWYDIALEYYFKSLAVRQEIGNKSGVAHSFNNIGLIYNAQNKYDDALTYLNRALSAYQELDLKSSTALALNNIGSIYRKQRRFDEAYQMHQKALAITQSGNNRLGLALTYNNLGALAEAQERYQEGLQHQLQSFELYSAGSDQKGVVNALTAAGSCSEKLRRYDQALEYVKRALQAASIMNARSEMKDCFALLARIYRNTGDLTRALDFHERYDALKDSLFNEESTKQIAEISTRYDSEVKTKEIALLQRDKEVQALFRNTLIGGIVLALIAAFTLFNRYLLKRRSETALQESNMQLIAANLEVQRQVDVLDEQARTIEAANTELQEKNMSLQQINTLLDIEKEMSESLLLNIMPEPIALRLKAGEQLIVDTFSDVTVMFADIVGFTKLTGQMKPDLLISLLDTIFTEFDAMAERHGVEKIKTIGDSYMAVCGLPEPNPHHCEAVANMALEMKDTIGRMAQELGIVGLTLRIGIHTGSAIAGVIGKKKFSYDLWGDTVNTASRMESHGMAGEIHCSEEVYQKLSPARLSLVIGDLSLVDGISTAYQGTNDFLFEERGLMEIRGKGMMHTYFLTGKSQ